MHKHKHTTLKSLAYLGAAICEGQPVRGVQKSPQLIRDTGILQSLIRQGITIKDYGDIDVSQIDTNAYPPVNFAVKNLHVLGPLLQKINAKVTSIVQEQQHQFLLTVGGDHSVGAATISALHRHYQNLKVIWVDAHPDCANSHIRMPNRIAYQNYHGMPLSHLTGITSVPNLPYFDWIAKGPQLDPKNVVLIAIRDIDPDQYISLGKSGIKCFTMDHVDKYGIGTVMSMAFDHLDPKDNSPFHLSFDIDGVDPDLAGQTGTRFRYGLTGRQSVHIVRRMAHEKKLVSMDLVQINEDLHPNEAKRKKYRGEEELKEMSHTVGLGVDLISSVFTKYFTL